MNQDTKIISIIGIITAVIVLGAVVFLSKPGQPEDGGNLGIKADPQLLIREDSQKIGFDQPEASGSAQVTVVEFSDYECPACAVVHPTVKRLLADYKGRIRFVFRNFPLPAHRNAIKAAQAAEIAGDQGKFWEMNDKLFADQNSWVKSNNLTDVFVGYAGELGLDTGTFRQAMDQNKYVDKIRRDYNDGNALRINQTPTFYINGEKYAGIPDYEGLKGKIDAELQRNP